ncbi:MAG: hypothetical protein QOH95_540 [Gaiellaceae bacterium]|jgi:hypothetical protein|nr:hypothetical protein [Gaiellaceae bacterium]
MSSRLVAAAALLVIAAGCGGSGSSKGTSGGQAASGSALVTKVEHATAKVEGSSIVATVKVSEGGDPGQHLSLRYGLVDAVSGSRASEEERLAAKYTTTASVASKDVSIRFPKPATPTDYLLHFVLYGPDGSYLASSDSDVFTVH